MDQANNYTKDTHCFSQATANAMWTAGIAPMSVQAVHQASKFQEEMVLATIADSKHQVNVETQHFICDERINVASLNHAAHALARRHVVLRSLFCWNEDVKERDPRRISMIILGTDYPRKSIKLVSEQSTQHIDMKESHIDFHVLGLPVTAENRQWHGEMPWKLTINSPPDQKGSRLSLSYHSAILDESSACRLLCYLWDELQATGSTKAVSDFFVAHRGQAFRRSRDMQRRVQERLVRAPPLPTVFGSTKTLDKEGYGETIVKVAITSARASARCMARQAIYMALCTFAKTKDAAFLELMSQRRLLTSSHRQVLGPVLVPQIRWAQHDSQTPLSDISGSLNSSCDIHHAFSPGELWSFVPNFHQRPLVSFICHTESCASSGVGALKWEAKESWSDVPLAIELTPCGGDSYFLRVCYHRNRFTDKAIVAFGDFLCASLVWQQQNQLKSQDIAFESAVDRIMTSCPDGIPCLKAHARQDESEPVREKPSIDLLGHMTQSKVEIQTKPVRSGFIEVEDKANVCAHHLLERSARRFPEKIALQYEVSDYLTYKELNEHCNLVAGGLTSWMERTYATAPDDETIIPISFDKGFELIIAMFSVLKAGAAFVPIDASLPVDRIAGIIRKAGAPFIVYDGKTDTDKLIEIARKEGKALVTLNDLRKMQDKRHPLSIRKEQLASSLAYIQVTSGTTGEPKCIMLEHRNLVAFMEADQPDFLGSWRTSKLQLSNRTFDIAMADIFGTLGRGGRLVLGPDAKILSSLAEWLEMTSVTDLNTAPLVADLLKEHVPAHLSVLMVGGEPFHPSLIQGIPKECRLYNNYGPSETTFVATTYTVSEEDANKSNIPIGRSFGSCTIHILVPDNLESVESGDIGEICISGPQVSRGYLGQPALTGKSFVPDRLMTDGNRKLYRTGDLGRFLPNGRLEYVGRKDRQVKLRGQRVETLEIEMVISKHPRVKACAVATGDSIHGMALVAFIETQPNQDPFADATAEELDWMGLIAEIKANLTQTLPDYMIPGRIEKLSDGLPRLPSNKLDRKALSSRATAVLAAQASQAAVEYVHPRDEVERHVCEAFGNVLSCRVGITNSFLDLGGHSVTAIRVASRIRKQLRTDITFRDVLECLTPETLSERIRSSAEEIAQSPATYETPQSMVVEQSFAQGRLWFLEQLHPNLSWYHMPLAFRLRGRLHLNALEAALQALEQRHETLRTTFEVRDGKNVQVVHPFRAKKIRILDLAGNPSEEGGLYSVLRSEQTKPFDLMHEPGWRVAVVRVSSREHVLSLVIHHIVADGWSLGVIMRELASFYCDSLCGKDPLLQLPLLPIQYREYSLWQRQEEQLREQQRQLAYWTHQLRGSHPAEFLCDKHRPVVPSGQAAVRGIKISGALYRNLGRLCKRHHITPFIVLLAAFRAAHYRMTGAADATIGTPITNRNREEHEGIIGLFVNMQCMRLKVSETDSFEALVEHVKEIAAAAFAHNEVPFETIVSELHPTREGSRNPLIQNIFAVHPERVDKIGLKGMDSELITLTSATRFDLEFHVYQCEEWLEGEIIFSTELFHERTIDILLSVFQDILRVGLEDPQTAIETISLSSGTSALAEMGLLEIRPFEYPRCSSIIDVFCQHVAAHPENTAVKDSLCQWSYARLDLESDKMAGWLRDLGLPKETVITVFAKRSCETIAAFLGILKANMAYLPLDVKFPAARIESILSSIEGNKLVLVGSECQFPINHMDQVDIIPMARPFSGVGESPAHTNYTMPGPNSLAYVMFTSGSTGQPKGVMIEHRAVVSRMKGGNLLDEEVAAKPFAHLSSIAFDASVWEIYTPLLNGGTVICIDSMTVTDYEALSNVFHVNGIRVALITPALLKQVLTESSTLVSQLHTLVVGGERADPKDMIKARKVVRCNVINAYGPTENTVFSTLYRLSGGDEYHNGVPIGQAGATSGAYVVDQQLCLVPPGVMGELLVVGDGLARGYTDTQRDVNRFVNIDIRGQRLRAYRTGDRVRRRPTDGQLEYIGRLDGQVKVRGFRVETEEIEHVLRSSGLVENAAVLVQHPTNEEARLIAFVTKLNDGDKQGPIDELASGKREQESEQAWKQIFSEITYDTQIDPREAGRDFSGWKSMYDGTEIDKEEMGEWLDDTIATLLNGGPPGNVLEIGTGSGMILFNIANDLQTYVGLEPVQSIVESVKTMMDKVNPTLASKVQLDVGSASDLDMFSSKIVSPDLVVVNSVVQYFPSAEYLSRLILDLLRKHQVKTIFFGDMRSYALYAQFQVTKALHGEDNISLAYIRQSMADTVENETELLIDPALFTSLAGRFPDLIHHVEILPKRMRATNELSCYRYSAIIHARRQDYLPIVHTVDADQWIDYSARGLSRKGLLDLLKQGSGSALIAIANIPHSKTILERLVVEALPNQTNMTDTRWLSSIRRDADEIDGLSAVDLADLGTLAGFHVELSWARQYSQHGGLDAIFHRIKPHSGQRTMFKFYTDHEGRSTREFSNTPMQSQSARSIERELQQFLKERLPWYMVPAMIRVLDDMPTNHSGKIDRQALSEVAATAVPWQATVDMVRVRPRNKFEAVVCEEFGHVLGCEVGVTDDFFDLGGHSLMATRAISRIVQRTQCAITVRDLFDCPMPEALASRISKICGEKNDEEADNQIQEIDECADCDAFVHDEWDQAVEAAGIRPEDVVHIMPCSPFQEGVLTADLVLKDSPAYLATIKLNFDGHLDVHILQSAWRLTVSREEMLRTAFMPSTQILPMYGMCSGAFLQAVLRCDSNEVERVSTLQQQGYDALPELGMGHIPVSLALRQNKVTGLKQVELTMHHALYDEAYLSCVLDGLSRDYRLVQNTDPTNDDKGSHMPFSTFIRTLQKKDRSVTASFWKKYLEGAPTSTWPISCGLRGPLDEDRIPQQACAEWNGDAETLSKLHGTTPAGIARAAFAMSIAAHSDSNDVIFGEVSSGRTQTNFVKGPCIATHPVRIQLALNTKRNFTNRPGRNVSIKTLLMRTRNAYLDTIPHQDFGLESIRQLTENPDLLPFQLLFVYQGRVAEGINHEGPGIRFSVADGELKPTDFPLVLEVFCRELTGRLHMRCVFDPVAILPADADWLLQHVIDSIDLIQTCAVQQQGERSPEAKLVIKEREKSTIGQLLGQDNAESAGDSHALPTVVELISEFAMKMPDKIALQVQKSEFITFKQVEDLSNSIAVGLEGVLNDQTSEAAEQRYVPIFFEKSFHMVSTIFGILKAGAAVVPMDIHHPMQRLETICRRCEATVLIWDGINGGEKVRRLAESTGITVCTVDGLVQNASQAYKRKVLPLDSLAYVLFTSGSTGVPKGVMVNHRNLSSFVATNRGSTDCSWTSNRLALLAPTFDASMGDLFATLCKGGRLLFGKQDDMLAGLSHCLEDLTVTHLSLTPTLSTLILKDLDKNGLSFLRSLVFGGEPFPVSILSRVPRAMTVWNGYGPTEATIEITACKVQAPDFDVCNGRSFVPIGGPGQNRHIRLLYPGTTDQVPLGSVGEVCISGLQVARGYLGQPDLTAEHFTPDPFTSTGQGKMYRTGDMARLHGDGYLEYLGRMDGQVKIRGFRIDTEEICSVAQKHPQITACAVTKLQTNGIETLTAFVELDHRLQPENVVSETTIKEHLARSLPMYMVPAFIWIQTAPLPRTTSGKLDRIAIAKMAEDRHREDSRDRSRRSHTPVRAAPGSLEAKIASLWAKVLGVEEDSINVTSAFHEVGGDSIRAIALLAILRRQELHLDLADVSQTSTVRSQAAKIGQKSDVEKNASYLHFRTRRGSVATIVLVHPFLAQSTVFEPLLPLLDDRFDVLLVDDPFMGTGRYPETLSVWASRYLTDISMQIQADHPVVFGGYSFGGLIAFEMAHIWDQRYGVHRSSVVLLDPGTYEVVDTVPESGIQRDNLIMSSLDMSEISAEDMLPLRAYFDGYVRALGQSENPPVYEGRCLHLALPDRLQDGVVDWWKAQCTNITLGVVDCESHYALLKDAVSLKVVSQLINEHCHAIIEENRAVSSASSGSRLYEGSSRTDVSTEDGDAKEQVTRI